MRTVVMVWRDPRFFVPYTFRRGPVPGTRRHCYRYRGVPILWDRALAPWGQEWRRCKANKRMSSRVLRARAKVALRKELAS